MTHTETTRESARHLEQACRCLASLTNAMSEATDEECKQRIANAIQHVLADVASAGAVFRNAQTKTTQTADATSECRISTAE